MIFVTSDLHFGHNKDFIYEPRGFSSIDEHDKEIIARWNQIVKPDDEVYILGDLMLGDNNHGIKCLKSLNGILHFVTGNHDTDKRVALYRTEWFDWCGDAYILKYKKYHFYLSHYPTLCGNHDEDKPLKNKMINLCGHSHVNNKWADADKGVIYHCELDAHNCYPVSLDKIIEDLKTFYS